MGCHGRGAATCPTPLDGTLPKLALDVSRDVEGSRGMSGTHLYTEACVCILARCLRSVSGVSSRTLVMLVACWLAALGHSCSGPLITRTAMAALQPRIRCVVEGVTSLMVS